MKMAELHAEVADLESEKDFQLRLKLEGILNILDGAVFDVNKASDTNLREWSAHTQSDLKKAIEQLKPLAGY